ncbi:hypothetical protein AB0D78_28540 [Streptomyces avermitilis]|uniref:hypothetical protein n=1 Tax=Streptomyces avermitilis TaxID=33903 RepID=UPI00340BAFDB
MTATDPQLSATVASEGALPMPVSDEYLPAWRAAAAQYGSDDDRALYAAYRQAMDEVKRLRGELVARIEGIAFTDRTTLPDLRRTIKYHEDGKKRWRDRAEKVEAERDALQERLHQIALAKVWTNEDRKHFVFLEDIVGPLFGIEPKEAGR